MYFKKLFFLLIFSSLTTFSVEKSIEIDTLLNKKKYKWIVTNTNEFIEKNILKKNEIDSILHNIATHLENTGYPFSTIEFRYDSIQNTNIYGKVLVKKGNLTKIDSVAIKGYNKFPLYLITRFLDIKENEIYQQNKIDGISKKIEKNIFIKEHSPPSILFNKEKTILFLYLNKKTNNSIDGFLGLNNNQEETSLYGKINLSLSNTLNMWESISIKWNKMNENSQELLLNFDFPFFLNSNFLLNTKINILQYNNSYINKELTSSLELNKKNHFLKLGYLHKRSNSINNNSDNLIQDYKKNLILLKWTYENGNLLSQKINYKISKEYKTGFNKTSIENNIRQHIELNLEGAFLLFENNYFYLNSNNKFLIGKNILENEKIGIGGINQIRGFLENSFFSKSLSLFNLENKYFFNNKSYLSLFYDLGKLYDLNTQLESFGIGIGIDMENDMFLINYAIPKNNKKIQINNSKIHFNYILKF